MVPIHIKFQHRHERDSHPAWSPDGARMVYVRSLSEKLVLRSWLMKSDGSGQAQLTSATGGDCSLDWWDPTRWHRHRVIPSISPLVRTNPGKAGGQLDEANNLLEQARSKGLNTKTCEKIMDEAKELLEKAKKSLINPPAANFYAIDALEKLKAAIDCLKALLG